MSESQELWVGESPVVGTKIWMENIYRQVCMFPVEDYQAVLDELERMDTVMPFLDPTAWMKGRDNLAGHRRAARAFVEFRRELEKLKT